MRKSNINGVLYLLTKNMSNEILPLSDKSLQMLSLKHPEAQHAHHEAILQCPKRQTHSILHEDIDDDLVKKAAIKPNRGCGQSGRDADHWCRILISNQIGSTPLYL